MEKKSLWGSMLTIMMVAMLCGVMTACSDDDNDNESGIVGTWTGSDGYHTLTLTFNSGNTGTYISKYEDQDSGTKTETGTFTYTTTENDSKGVVIIKYYGSSTDVFYYVIDDNIMRLYENDYYDSLKWILAKDGSGSTVTNANNAIGTWTGTEAHKTLTLIFNSGNSGDYVYRDGGNTDAGTFVYAAEGSNKGVLVIRFSASYSGTSSGIFFYVIDGKTMRLYERGYYDSLAWTLTKQ